jgi:hypothetical protein
MEPNQDLVAELAKNEIILSDLYKIHANIQPELREFWAEIANDETHHADILMQLDSEIKDGRAAINPDRFSLKDIQIVRTFIQDKIDQTKTQADALTNTQTLIIADYIESFLLEKEFFKIFETDSAVLINALTAVQEDTERHLLAVSDKIREYTHINI